MEGYFEKAHELASAGIPFVSVTLVEAIGSTPQDSGSKMIVTHEGLAFGTVGGGRVEAKAIDHAQSMLAQSSPKTLLVNWNLQTDIKMTCGGAVKLYFETHHHQPWQIVIFGAGHIAQALVRTLLNLNCKLTVFDHRAAWLQRLPDSPKLDKHHTQDLPAQAATIPPNASVLLMTMGHSTDLPILLQLLKRNDLAYIGVIGSGAKRASLKKAVIQSGIADQTFEKVHCPMGLEIGTNHPYEIAISIAAQLIQIRDTKPAPQ
jgi:xanthine dehydrogenase accessory factor